MKEDNPNKQKMENKSDKMSSLSCPGATRIKEPIPEFFICPSCNAEVEIWTNENFRKCGNCGGTVFREQLPSCIEWCDYGKECVGEEAYNRYMKAKESKGEDKGKLKEEEANLKELMEKVKKYCKMRSDKHGEETDN